MGVGLAEGGCSEQPPRTRPRSAVPGPALVPVLPVRCARGPARPGAEQGGGRRE